MLIKRFILLVDSLLRLYRASAFKNSTEKEYYAPSEQMATGRIYGGTNANIEDHPWMVSVYFHYPSELDFLRSYFVCGGSIVADNAILTAAHCALQNEKYMGTIPCWHHGAGITVIAGRNDTFCDNCRNAQSFYAKNWIRHPDYMYTNTTNYVVNNIPVLKLSRHSNFKSYYIQKNIMSTLTKVFWNTLETLEIAGWGMMSEYHTFYGTMLTEADLTLVGKEFCSGSLGKCICVI